MFVVPAMVVVLMVMAVGMLFPAAVQVLHVVVVILVDLVQDDVKIAGIEPGLLHPAYADAVAVQRKALKRFQEFFFISPKVQQSCHRHVAGDPGAAFEVEFLHKSVILCGLPEEKALPFQRQGLQLVQALCVSPRPPRWIRNSW